MALIFDCQLRAMPFTYLGLPMGTTQSSVKYFSPIIDRIDIRRSTIVPFLSYGDNLVLFNSILSYLPTYFMCTVVIPLGVIEIIDKARGRCMWSKDKNKKRVNSLVSSSMICKPKDKGVLGIINLRFQNQALLIKHLDKFYDNVDVPWVKLIRDAYYYDIVPHVVTLSSSFWWKGVFGLVDVWREMSTCKALSGSSVLFWDDKWQDETLSQKFPSLHSFAKDRLISVRSFRVY
jgi:hypothetical protein